MPTTRSSFSGSSAGARFAPPADLVGAFVAVLRLAAGRVFFAPDFGFLDAFAGVDPLIVEDAAFFFFVDRFDFPPDLADVDFLADICETLH
jgi:hypothetical protein